MSKCIHSDGGNPMLGEQVKLATIQKLVRIGMGKQFSGCLLCNIQT